MSTCSSFPSFPLSVLPYLLPSWPASSSPAISQPHMLYLFQTSVSFYLALFSAPYHPADGQSKWPTERQQGWEGRMEGGREEGKQGSTFSLYLCLYLFLSFTLWLTDSVKLNNLMRMPAVLKGRCEFIKLRLGETISCIKQPTCGPRNNRIPGRRNEFSCLRDT